MLIHPTTDKLHTLKLTGMAKALDEQQAMADIDELNFEARLGLLVDRELTERENRRLSTRLKRLGSAMPAVLKTLTFVRPEGWTKR